MVVDAKAFAPSHKQGTATITIDLDGIVVGWGRAAEALLGYRSDEILGTPLWDRLGWDPCPLLRSISLERTILDASVALRCKDRSALPAFATASPLLAGDRVAGACLTVRPARGMELEPLGRGLLNERQLVILGLLAEGLRNAEIAERLHLSESTVKWHVKRILRTLRVANRAEAAARYERARHAPR